MEFPLKRDSTSPSSLGDVRLDKALRNLRKVFQAVRGKPNWFDSCAGADSSVTTKRNVFDLTQDEFEEFCWHSACENLEKDGPLHVRYFLPRVAYELCRYGDSCWCDFHLTFQLNRLEWKSWRTEEANAIHSWFVAWVVFEAMQAPPIEYRAAMCAGICGVDLSDAYGIIQAADPNRCAAWISELLRESIEELYRTGWPRNWDAYWQDASANHDDAINFLHLLLRDESVDLMERAFLEVSDETDRKPLSDAIEYTRVLRGSLDPPANSPLNSALRTLHVDRSEGAENG